MKLCKICILLLALLLLYGCKIHYHLFFEKEEANKTDAGLSPVAVQGRFGAVMGDNDFSVLQKSGITWARLLPGEFVWGKIEIYPGQYYWNAADFAVMLAQEKKLKIVGVILPYNDADQDICRPKYNATIGPFEQLGERRYMPCDMEEYSRFVTALVERYDGDGYNDMPGLRYGIKHWEVLTEPDVSEQYRIFFSGTPNDYYAFLKATYEAAKRADPESVILNGGLSGTKSSFEFFDKVLELGGGDYIDAANVHSLGENPDLNVKEMKDLLKKHGLDKKVWVTAAAFCDKKRDEKEIASLLVKSYVTAFANGAERIFYYCPSESYSEFGSEKKPNIALSALIVLIMKTDDFSAIEKLTDTHYKFISRGKTIYVAWNNHLPLNYNKIRVTDFDGGVTEMSMAELKTGDIPTFFEPVYSTTT